MHNRIPFDLPTSLRSSIARVSLAALVLVTPAAAIAAEPVADSQRNSATARAEAASATTGKPLGLPVTQAFRDSRAGVRKLVRAETAPTHPVSGGVDYGSAEAAFGNARGRPHEGQDVFAAAGTKLVAPVDVEVVDGGSDGGRGNWIALFDRKRERTYSYFHMLGPAEVKVGEKLEEGDRVGEVGCTGSCWGDHLHFEIREGKGPYGTAIDPLPFLKRAR